MMLVVCVVIFISAMISVSNKIWHLDAPPRPQHMCDVLELDHVDYCCCLSGYDQYDVSLLST